MKKKRFLLIIASIVAIILFSVGCDNGANGDTAIDIAAISGVTAPVGGATPVTTITETDQYTGTVSWSPADSTFGYETVYTATITLTAKSGYTLTGIKADFFTVAGASTVTNDADSGVITAVFPETGVVPTAIDIAAIPGVTAPVGGATPVTTITETDQYTGTVSWSPAENPFGYETVYTATITLTAKSGYTLTGVKADFFTVAGASTVTNDAGSGVIKAVFPETGLTPPKVIDLTAIPGVTPPAVGGTPVTTITETDQYTGTVSWDTDDNTFGYGTVYTATITLTAKSGYTLNGVTAGFFTVAGADPVSNDADSGVVTAVFPATTPLTKINIAVITGVTAPAGGASPVTTINETAQYTGTVSWSPADSTFGYGTVYTATITLTAKSGYTFTGVTADYFTLTGASSVSNNADSGVITAVFPETGGITVTYNANGGAAGTAPTDTTEYSSEDEVTVLGNTGNLVGAEVGGDHIGAGIKQRFLGWDKDSSATTATYAPGSTFTITEDTTLYAIYTTGTDVLKKVGPAGGFVFYDAGSNQDWGRYFEAWTSDESVQLFWKSDRSTTSGTSTEIGTGYANTYTYMTGSVHPAAETVRNATHGGFDDWFIPSKDELSLVYDNLLNISEWYQLASYWTSSEQDVETAWAIKFIPPTPLISGYSKNALNRVRAVRAF